MRLHSRVPSFAAAVVAAALGFSPLPALSAAGDGFYTDRLREGRIAYSSGQLIEACDLLKIAAFGLMESPPLLSEALAFEALAQAKAGRTQDVEATTRRFLEVERRFSSWTGASVPEKERRELEALLKKTVTPELLASFPTLNGDAAKAALAIKVATVSPPPPPVPAPEPAASPDPAPAPAPPPMPAPAPPEPTRAERKAMLEKATLSKEWKGAAAQLRALEPLGDGEEVQMFYAAVTFYESGKVVEAKPLMERAYPKIAHGPYVDYYAKKLLR